MNALGIGQMFPAQSENTAIDTTITENDIPLELGGHANKKKLKAMKKRRRRRTGSLHISARYK